MKHNPLRWRISGSRSSVDCHSTAQAIQALYNAFIYHVKAQANQRVIQQLISVAKKTEVGNVYKGDHKEAVSYCKKQAQLVSNLEILTSYKD